MTFYTASGARRTGDEYQDLQSAEVLIEWLEQPDAYRWVRLETTAGSLDDIQAERADGTRRLLQVKFGTDASVEWEWHHLTKQESGKMGPRPSLLQKWKISLDDVVASGVAVSEAALLTNRAASTAIRDHLSGSSLVDFGGLPAPLQATIAAQLRGVAAASGFFESFHFYFKQLSFEALESVLRERFHCLGGSSEGWESLMRNVRRWINRKDEPTTDGTIYLRDVRAAALWRVPPQIPQGFLVPDDYVAPSVWSEQVVEPRLGAGGDSIVAVTGSPGAGKSTYLSWLVEHLRNTDVPVVRHHYFLSTTDVTPHRTDWETAADSIIGKLLLSYEGLVRNVDKQNPLPGTLREFLVAAGREREGSAPLVVMVDGLDHVWRDTGSEEGLRRLFDLLLPVPDGVVLVVGTQDIDLARIPRKLRDLCPRDRWLEVPVLDGEGGPRMAPAPRIRSRAARNPRTRRQGSWRVGRCLSRGEWRAPVGHALHLERGATRGLADPSGPGTCTAQLRTDQQRGDVLQGTVGEHQPGGAPPAPPARRVPVGVASRRPGAVPGSAGGSCPA